MVGTSGSTPSAIEDLCDPDGARALGDRDDLRLGGGSGPVEQGGAVVEQRAHEERADEGERHHAAEEGEEAVAVVPALPGRQLARRLGGVDGRGLGGGRGCVRNRLRAGRATGRMGVIDGRHHVRPSRCGRRLGKEHGA